jgi:hypothetical protein
LAVQFLVRAACGDESGNRFRPVFAVDVGQLIDGCLHGVEPWSFRQHVT